MVLVGPESKFRELASHDVVDGGEYLTAAFEMHGGGKSRWAPVLVERERVGERLGSAAVLIRERDESELLGVDSGREGFLGEMEVIRRLAEAEALNLFRPFPDLETVEVLARHVDSGRFLGLRVKTAGWDREHAEERVYMRRSSFDPFPTTYVCVLMWDRSAARFGDDCLLIPSEDMVGLVQVEAEALPPPPQPPTPPPPPLDFLPSRL